MQNTNLKNYKAVILAGGKETRLYPITEEMAKPLLPINRKPIINHLVNLFKSYGIKKIAVLVSKKYKPEFLMIEKDIFPQLAQERKLGGFKFNGYWTDCGTWERYEKAFNDTY